MQFDPKLYMAIVFVVLLSSVSWLYIGIMHDDLSIWLRVVMIVVGIFAILLMSQRDIYLPFLGETAFPMGIIEPTKNKGSVHFTLEKLPPDSKVVYWAAIPKSKGQIDTKGWKEAYNGFVNGGVATSDKNGKAILTLDCPQSYEVGRLGFKHILPKHVHYRYQLNGDKSGLMSRIMTEKISCEL